MMGFCGEDIDAYDIPLPLFEKVIHHYFFTEVLGATGVGQRMSSPGGKHDYG